MSFGLYKPGQGYYVRVLAAVMAGMIVLAASAWLWMQVGAIDLPYGSYRIPLSGAADGTLPPGVGVKVELLGDVGGAAPGLIGAGEVVGYESSGGPSGTLTVKNIKIEHPEKFDPTMTKRLRAPGGYEAAAATPVGVPIVEPVYVQAAAVGVVMLVGAVLTYWMVGVRGGTVEFLIATDGEMKKVNWSSWKDIRGSTLVVIFASFLIAAGLFGVDFVFSAFFKLIGVLQQ